MRINKFIAQHTHLSRRQADEAIKAARVTINGETAQLGDEVQDSDTVTLDNSPVRTDNQKPTTLLLNKPVGYVCSRDGQGSPTVYDLIPKKYHNLNIAGRLDKDSSGLVVLTSDGDLLYELTHPSNDKEKVYQVTLNRELTESELELLMSGVDIGDERLSKFESIENIGPKKYKIILKEGRNRQIRRTVEVLKLIVLKLVRNKIGQYSLDNIEFSKYLLLQD